MQEAVSSLLLVLVNKERSSLVQQGFLAGTYSDFSPFLPVTSPTLAVSPCFSLDFSNLCVHLLKPSAPNWPQHSKSTPAVATAESFPPVFHGNHIVNLPDFNSLRRMMHSVCDSMHRPDSHVSNSCLASYFLPYTLFIFLTPVSFESGTFSLP